MNNKQHQENLSRLLNVDRLLSQMSQVKPQDLLSLPLSNTNRWNRPSSDGQKIVQIHVSSPFEQINSIYSTFCKDIMASRDRLLLLNPGRRRMVEHRLEFISRKLARAKGEKLSRSISLTDLLKESFRDQEPNSPHGKIFLQAWKSFVGEVALFNILEIFFLKCLENQRWRNFELSDLGNLNFAVHSFISQRAVGFAYDRHCWNFTRSNLYSWYNASQRAQNEIVQALNNIHSPSSPFSWSDQDLLYWVSNMPEDIRLPHLQFAEEYRIAGHLLDFLERDLRVPLADMFHEKLICRKVFIPTLEWGGVALGILDQLLARLRRYAANPFEGGIGDETSQIQRAIWGCESESLEMFWTEVVALLKLLGSFAGRTTHQLDNPSCLYRIPQILRAVQVMGPELHNLEQLALGNPELARIQQGTAAQIQQIETFDLAIVSDHPDRTKSARWMKALSEQLPYWRRLVGTGTNLNWGELHLYLALSKLKDEGYCLYLTHRPLPDSVDGEKMRKALLSLSTLECFIELHHDDFQPYRYLYVFKRSDSKAKRDQHHPRFGCTSGGPHVLETADLEEASPTQSEILERGWDHLFVRGAAPLVRHLQQKFPKLFQLASIQTVKTSSSPADLAALIQGLSSDSQTSRVGRAIEVDLEAVQGNPLVVRFRPLLNTASPFQGNYDRLVIIPHNQDYLPWMQCLLNSAPVQFWIRNQVFEQGRQLKINELRSCPIVDLSHAPPLEIQENLAWLQKTSSQASTLMQWSELETLSLPEKHSRFAAVATFQFQLERTIARYRPLFVAGSMEELRHDAITEFYPTQFLVRMSRHPDVRMVYLDKHRSSIGPENWALQDCTTEAAKQDRMASTFVHTKQGPIIQITAPSCAQEFLVGQLRALRDHLWSDALELVRLPGEVALFEGQVTEIRNTMKSTTQKAAVYRDIIDRMSNHLFDIPSDLLDLIPH